MVSGNCDLGIITSGGTNIMTTQALNSSRVNRTGILIRGLIIMLSAGIVNAAAIFVSPLASFKGLEAEAVAGAATFMGTFTVIGHFFGGILLSKIGAKLTTTLGGIFICLAFAGTALVPPTSPGLLYVTYGSFFGMGIGFSYHLCLCHTRPDRDYDDG